MEEVYLKLAKIVETFDSPMIISIGTAENMMTVKNRSFSKLHRMSQHSIIMGMIGTQVTPYLNEGKN